MPAPAAAAPRNRSATPRRSPARRTAASAVGRKLVRRAGGGHDPDRDRGLGIVQRGAHLADPALRELAAGLPEAGDRGHVGLQRLPFMVAEIVRQPPPRSFGDQFGDGSAAIRCQLLQQACSSAGSGSAAISASQVSSCRHCQAAVRSPGRPAAAGSRPIARPIPERRRQAVGAASVSRAAGTATASSCSTASHCSR